METIVAWLLIGLGVAAFLWLMQNHLRNNAEFDAMMHVRGAFDAAIEQLDVDSAAHLYATHLLILEERARGDTLNQDTADSEYRVNVVCQVHESLRFRTEATGKKMSLLPLREKIWSAIYAVVYDARDGKGGPNSLRDRIPQFPYEKQKINLPSIQEFDAWSRQYFMSHQSRHSMKRFEKLNRRHAEQAAKS